MKTDEERAEIEKKVINQMCFAIPKPETIEDGCRLAVQLTIDEIEENSNESV